MVNRKSINEFEEVPIKGTGRGRGAGGGTWAVLTKSRINIRES